MTNHEKPDKAQEQPMSSITYTDPNRLRAIMQSYDEAYSLLQQDAEDPGSLNRNTDPKAKRIASIMAQFDAVAAKFKEQP